MTRRDVLRLALDDRRAGRRLTLGRLGPTPRPGRCPTPRPSTCPAGVGSTCSTSSWSTSRSRSRSATSPTSPSWASTSSGCRWITAAGPTPRDPKTLKEPVLKEIDQAVELGRKHGVHVQINFHRAPGFTVAKPAGAEVALDRPRDPGRLRPPLGELRGALSGHAEQPGQLQPAQRARRQGQAGGPPPRRSSGSPRRSASAIRSG